MKRALLFVACVLLAGSVLVPASAGAEDESQKGVVTLDKIIIEGTPARPKVMLMLMRAPIGFRLPELEYDSLTAVGESVQDLD